MHEPRLKDLHDLLPSFEANAADARRTADDALQNAVDADTALRDLKAEIAVETQRRRWLRSIPTIPAVGGVGAAIAAHRHAAIAVTALAAATAGVITLTVITGTPPRQGAAPRPTILTDAPSSAVPHPSTGPPTTRSPNPPPTTTAMPPMLGDMIPPTMSGDSAPAGQPTPTPTESPSPIPADIVPPTSPAARCLAEARGPVTLRLLCRRA